MIIKSYVALASLCTIDDTFAACVPKPIKQNAIDLNKSEKLKMTKDFNTNKLILQNCCTPENRDKLSVIFNSFINILINLWYGILQEI